MKAKNKYTAFFAAYNASVKSGNPYSKDEQVAIFTHGRTESLKDLSDQELRELTAQLNNQGNATNKADTMRKAIISIFHKMNYTNPAAAAKSWCEKMGVGSGDQHVKRLFNDYSTQELKKLIYKAELALESYRKSILKK